jgi:glycosyltransferase involved in cell wall biosynthesis
LESHGFTVLLPTYDRIDLCEIFDKAVDSCLNNTLQPNAIVIVIDGPVRSEFSVKIKKYEKHPLIEIVWLPKNVGLTRALNIGLQKVKTKYVFRADGDDVSRLNRFDLQMGILNSGYGLVSGAVDEFDEFSNYIATKRVPSSHEKILHYCKRRNPFNHTAIAFELKSALDVGGYPDLYLMEDWGLWILMLEQGVQGFNSQEIFVDVSGGSRMYDRRGGLKNISGEVGIQRFLVRHAKKPRLLAVFDFLGRVFLMNIPNKWKSFVFVNFMRTKN